jgi:hypothetical protein
MPRPQFNFVALTEDSSDATSLGALVRWLNRMFRRLSDAMPGPTSIALGNSGATKTIKVYETDLAQLTLTANCAVTLDIASRKGAVGDLELTQDGTGSRTVTWTNALWASGTPPTIASGANKRTLIRFINVGKAWVGSVHASNY